MTLSFTQKRPMLNFEYSYLSLPGKFYQLVKPASFSKPETALLNEALLEELNIPFTNQQDLISFLSGNESDGKTSSFAQAYAGHQFGNFTNLGDGRAIVTVSYTHLRAHETDSYLVCRLLLEKKK